MGAQIDKKWLYSLAALSLTGIIFLLGLSLLFNGSAQETDDFFLSETAYIDMAAARAVMNEERSLSDGTAGRIIELKAQEGAGAVQQNVVDQFNTALQRRHSVVGSSNAEAFDDPDMVPLGRTAPYPYVPVDLARALAGAITGTPQGKRDLQGYMDGSKGNSLEIRDRAFALLEGLSNSGIRNDFIILAQATNRITDAAAESYGAAYMTPFLIDNDFMLQDHMQGWDMGPQGKSPYFGFTRIGPADPAVQGTNIQALEKEGVPTLITDGLLNMISFGTALPDGVYQIYLLSSSLPNGGVLDFPFGIDVRTNGQATRLLDASRPVDGETVFRLAASGVMPEKASLDDTTLTNNDPAGLLIAARAFVRDGTIRIELGADAEDARTYVTAIVLVSEDPGILQEQLAERIASMLNQVAPAAGAAQIAQLVNNFQDRFTRPNTPPLFQPRPSSPPSSGGITGPGAPTFPPSPPPDNGGVPDDTSGTTDGGTTDGGTTDGGTTDGGTTDGGTTDGGTTDGGTTDGGTTDGGTTNGGTTDGGTTDGGTTDGGTTDGGTTDGGTTDGGTTDGGTTDGGTTDGGPDDLIAEAGVYEPVFLGGDILLNGCGSTLNDDLVCLLDDPSQFTFIWTFDDMILGTGFELLLETGENTPFNQSGDFLVMLELALNGRPDLVSIDTAIIRILDRAIIPIPATILLFVLGLGFFGWRRSKN